MKWTLFKDELPERGKWIFVTNFDDVWTAISPEEIRKSKIFQELELAWASIDMPKVPLKPKYMHLCRQGHLSCYEDEDGGLVLRNFDHKAKVDFCPFCGKKSEKDS